jgi:hypothetical protein
MGKGLFDWLLTFIYSLAHMLGDWFVNVLDRIFKFEKFPESLIDPTGFLMVLTIFFIVVSLAKKVAKWILFVGWGLILIKILIVIFKG